jgi:hypothetical protein
MQPNVLCIMRQLIALEDSTRQVFQRCVFIVLYFGKSLCALSRIRCFLYKIMNSHFFPKAPTVSSLRIKRQSRLQTRCCYKNYLNIDSPKFTSCKVHILLCFRIINTQTKSANTTECLVFIKSSCFDPHGAYSV